VPGLHRTSLVGLPPRGGDPEASAPYRAGELTVKDDQMISSLPAAGGCEIIPPVHLLPAERGDRRVIDGERVCQAIAAIGSSAAIQARARDFAVLGDPTRLMLLTCIKAAGPISVSDLAAATGLNDTTVSQTLRYLRASQTVSTERDGRVVRYRLADSSITPLLTDL
jgi:ArsR family transcriptional regulator, lead/cadmium/zinc/bismuth-responsive transcriptional repressor